MAQDLSADITVLIVAFNSRAHAPRLRAALDAQTVRPAAVKILDNGSCEAGRLSPDALPTGTELITSSVNLGFAAGNNRLAKAARTRWIAFLNPDAFPAKDWIAQIQAAIATYRDAKIFGSTQIDADQPGRLDGAGDAYHLVGFPWRGGHGQSVARAPRHDGRVFSACGAAMVMERALFDELGGFDEAFFCYCEDVDLGYRARLRGEHVLQLSGAVVHHVGSGSSGGDWRFAFHHGLRNRLWTYLQNTPPVLLWLTAPLHAGATGLQFLSAVRRGRAKAFVRAIGAGLGDWRRVMAVRAERQKTRTVSSAKIAAAMTANPLRLARRDADIRPVSARPAGEARRDAP